MAQGLLKNDSVTQFVATGGLNEALLGISDREHESGCVRGWYYHRSHSPPVEKGIRFGSSRCPRRGQVIVVGILRRTTVPENRYWQDTRVLRKQCMCTVGSQNR